MCCLGNRGHRYHTDWVVHVGLDMYRTILHFLFFFPETSSRIRKRETRVCHRLEPRTKNIITTIESRPVDQLGCDTIRLGDELDVLAVDEISLVC
jgi:hypothetical protein